MGQFSHSQKRVCNHSKSLNKFYGRYEAPQAGLEPATL